MQGELRVFGKMKGDSAIAPCQINGVHIVRQEGNPFAAARTLVLWRANGSPAVSGNSAFLDVTSDAYYATAVAWAEKNGVRVK